jgi:hypothetical protein
MVAIGGNRRELLSSVFPLSAPIKIDAYGCPRRDGEVHKWQLDAQGNHLHRAEYIPPANHDNPFVLVINEDDMQEMRHAVGRHEGCNVQGWIDVEVSALMVSWVLLQSQTNPYERWGVCA